MTVTHKSHFTHKSYFQAAALHQLKMMIQNSNSIQRSGTFASSLWPSYNTYANLNKGGATRPSLMQR